MSQRTRMRLSNMELSMNTENKSAEGTRIEMIFDLFEKLTIDATRSNY